MNGIMLSPETLRKYPLFAGIDDSILRELAMLSEEIVVEEGHWLFHDGDEADALYLILSGKVAIKIPVTEKDMYPPSLTQLVEGHLFGWSALVEPYVYTMGALVIQNARLAKMDGVSLCALMAQHPAFGYKFISRILKVVGQRLTDLRIRFISLVEGGCLQTVEKGRPSRPANSN